METPTVTELEGGLPPSVAPPENGETWLHDKNGEAYIRRGGGRPGIIKRQGEETIEQARARDAQASEKRPKPKPKRPKMPPGPKKVDLKALEEELAGALKAPGAVCLTFGDEWAFNHFNTSGPYLARHLILAADHNPWLRKKLEEAVNGEEAMMKIISVLSVGGAVVGYVVPPIVWWFNVPIPDRGRKMWGIPEREERSPDYAAATPGPQGPEHPFPA